MYESVKMLHSASAYRLITRTTKQCQKFTALTWHWSLESRGQNFRDSVFYRTRVRSLFSLVTDSLTNSCLANLIDVTLACEDTNTKLVDVVTVTDEDPVGNNLLQISKLRFGKKAKLLFILWAQGLVKILKLKFRQDLRLASFFSADVL